jgi:ABC-type Na+ efflux pump permease subunit
VGLSLFPLTAPITFTMRAALAAIPAWQIAANLLVMGLSALGALWLAGRALRLGMLRYGQRVAWRELFTRPAAHPAEGGQP